MQANRYRYFADAAIVVLPMTKLKIAEIYLDTFKTINVGLWGFDPEKNQIIALYTPRPGTSLTPKHKIQVIQLLARASRFLHSV
jgi:hypothetical protein